MSENNFYIALLRGINVGGHNRIKMADLRQILGSLGLKEVQTYLASGNVVFKTGEFQKDRLTGRIRDEIKENRGFEPRVILLTLAELEQAVKANPFPEATNEPK